MTDFSHLKVLVADDDSLLLDFVKTVLKNMEIGEITTAKDGAEAVRLIVEAEKDFDLIICDYEMPCLNGMDVFRLLRKAGLASKFVMLTAHDRVGEAETIANEGCHNFLTKPIKPETLAETLKVIIGEE